jgi:aconitase B
MPVRWYLRPLLKSDVLLDEVRAGGRINLIIGRGLTTRARESLGLPESDLFRRPEQPVDTGKGFTLAQKMVGRACGMEGMRPGTYCEPRMTTVGSKDTTGPMTRDELKDLGRSMGVRSAGESDVWGFRPLPRWAGVISARYLLLGASTP